MRDENLVPLDGPPTLVSTNQAVWGAPGTQGRLVHLGENISVRNLMFDLSLRQAQLKAFLFQKVGIGKTKFFYLLFITFSSYLLFITFSNFNQLQGVFLTGPTQKVLSVRLHSKSHQKSSKCQNLVTEKNL